LGEEVGYRVVGAGVRRQAYAVPAIVGRDEPSPVSEGGACLARPGQGVAGSRRFCTTGMSDVPWSLICACSSMGLVGQNAHGQM
jgi:hypothetical protein